MDFPRLFRICSRLATGRVRPTGGHGCHYSHEPGSTVLAIARERNLDPLLCTCHAVVASGEREFVVSFTANTRRSRFSDERTRARGPACAAELSRRVAHCVADFLPIHRLVNSACVAAGNFAFRAGLPRRNGPEPNRSLATQTWRPPLRQCDTADACTHRPDYHDHRVCNPAVDQPDAGTVAERTKTRARPSNPDRIAHAKLSGRSRGVARH